MTAASPTAELAASAAQWAQPGALEPVRVRLTDCILDHLACVLEGAFASHLTYPDWVLAGAGDKSDATTVAGRRVSVAGAAYVNGQAANALDFDDTLLGHPGAAVIPAALAVAEGVDASVERLMAGVAAGYDAHWRLASAGMPTPRRASQVRGFAVWETVAAGVAAAVTCGMGEEEIRRVIGLAVAHAPVPYVGKWYERPVPTIKNNLGWASAAGVTAVELATRGASGVPDALDGPTGLWRMAGSDRWRWDAVRGTKNGALERVAFKRFPACWHLQQYLAVLETKVRAEVLGHGSEGAVIYAGPDEVRKFMDYDPAGSADIAFSLPTLTALVIDGCEPGVEWATAARYGSHGMKQRARAVEFHLSATRWVATGGGTGLSSRHGVRVANYLDPAKWGLDHSEVGAKFDRLVGRRLGPERAAALRVCLERDPSGTRARTLAEFLQGRREA